MKAVPLRHYVWTWLALLGLLGITFGSAYVRLGAGNLFVNLGVSVLKTLLVMLVFMELTRRSSVVRLVAAAGFFWLALLVALSVADFLTRP